MSKDTKQFKPRDPPSLTKPLHIGYFCAWADGCLDRVSNKDMFCEGHGCQTEAIRNQAKLKTIEGIMGAARSQLTDWYFETRPDHNTCIMTESGLKALLVEDVLAGRFKLDE